MGFPISIFFSIFLFLIPNITPYSRTVNHFLPSFYKTFPLRILVVVNKNPSPSSNTSAKPWFHLLRHILGMKVTQGSRLTNTARSPLIAVSCSEVWWKVESTLLSFFALCTTPSGLTGFDCKTYSCPWMMCNFFAVITLCYHVINPIFVAIDF